MIGRRTSWRRAAGPVALLAVLLAGCAGGTGRGVRVTPAAQPGTATSSAPSSGATPSSATAPASPSTPALADPAVRPSPPTAAHPWERYLVKGPLSGVTAAVLVRLPPEWFAPGAQTRRFPVLETFHGVPGHAPQWLGRLRVAEKLDALVAQHRASPAIVVSPDLNHPDETDRECVDVPGGPALETWLTQDVPDWVERNLRGRTDAAGWATIGLSTGGWCAAMAAMLHPDRYRAAIVMSGYFRPEFPAKAPWPADDAHARRYDLVALAASSPPPVAVWLSTSQADPNSWPTSRALATAKPPLHVTSVVLTGQDHAWDVWARLTPQALTWLAGHADGFAPKP